MHILNKFLVILSHWLFVFKEHILNIYNTNAVAITSIISSKCISEKEVSGWNSLTINLISQKVGK